MDSEKKKQLDKFKDAARELECDDDEKRFRDRLGRLARPSRTGKVGPPNNGKGDGYD